MEAENRRDIEIKMYLLKASSMASPTKSKFRQIVVIFSCLMLLHSCLMLGTVSAQRTDSSRHSMEDISKSLSKSFGKDKPTTVSMWNMALLISVGVLAILAIAWFSKIIERENEQRKRTDKPNELFDQLCMIHDIGPKHAKLIKSIAAASNIAEPCEAFLEPAVFANALRSDRFKPQGKSVRIIFERIFKGLNDVPSFHTQEPDDDMEAVDSPDASVMLDTPKVTDTATATDAIRKVSSQQTGRRQGKRQQAEQRQEDQLEAMEPEPEVYEPISTELIGESRQSISISTEQLEGAAAPTQSEQKRTPTSTATTQSVPATSDPNSAPPVAIPGMTSYVADSTTPMSGIDIRSAITGELDHVLFPSGDQNADDESDD